MSASIERHNIKTFADFLRSVSPVFDSRTALDVVVDLAFPKGWLFPRVGVKGRNESLFS